MRYTIINENTLELTTDADYDAARAALAEAGFTDAKVYAVPYDTLEDAEAAGFDGAVVCGLVFATQGASAPEPARETLDERIARIVARPTRETLDERIARIVARPTPEGERELLADAHALECSDEAFRKIADAHYVGQGPTVELPLGKFERLSRGRGWARKGQGDRVAWGERTRDGYTVGPGRWTVGSTDGFSRKSSVDWWVEHVQVGTQTWTLAFKG